MKVRTRAIAATAVLCTLAGLAVATPVAADARTGVVTVPVGRWPAVVAVDPGPHTAYVLNQGNGLANNGNGTISVVNGTDVRTIRAGGTPVGIAIDTTTHTAYVAVGNTQSQLLEITGTKIRRIAVSNPVAVAVDSSNGTVWLLEAQHLLIQIVGHTQTSYPLEGSLPDQLAFDAHLHEPYVLSPDGVLSSVSSGRVFVQHLSGEADAIAVNDTTGEVFVAHSTYFSGGLQHPALLSEVSGLYLRLVDLGNQYIGGLAVNDVTNTAAVSEYNPGNRAYGQVAFVTDQRVRQHKVGGSPGAIAVNSADGAACVVNRWSGTASIVSDTGVQTVATGNGPLAVATDDGGQLCYVTNSSDDTVSEVSMP